MSPYPPVDERPALLTPDEYMTLLVERAREADEQSRAERAAAGLPPAPAWIRHLPEWMVRDGDEDLVDMTAVAAWTARHEEQPKRARTPRVYRPASHWRAELAKIDAALASEDARTHHGRGTTDRAAYGGIGIRRTARQQRRDWAALDRSIERVVRLQNRRVAVVAKLHRAEAREAS